MPLRSKHFKLPEQSLSPSQSPSHFPRGNALLGVPLSPAMTRVVSLMGDSVGDEVTGVTGASVGDEVTGVAVGAGVSGAESS